MSKFQELYDYLDRYDGDDMWSRMEYADEAKAEYDALAAELAQERSDRQREHDLRVRLAGTVEALEAALHEAIELMHKDLAAYKSEAPLVTAEMEAFLDKYDSASETSAERCKHGVWAADRCEQCVAETDCAHEWASWPGSIRAWCVKCKMLGPSTPEPDSAKGAT